MFSCEPCPHVSSTSSLMGKKEYTQDKHTSALLRAVRALLPDVFWRSSLSWSTLSRPDKRSVSHPRGSTWSACWAEPAYRTLWDRYDRREHWSHDSVVMRATACGRPAPDVSPALGHTVDTALLRLGPAAGFEGRTPQSCCRHPAAAETATDKNFSKATLNKKKKHFKINNSWKKNRTKNALKTKWHEHKFKQSWHYNLPKRLVLKVPILTIFALPIVESFRNLLT